MSDIFQFPGTVGTMFPSSRCIVTQKSYFKNAVFLHTAVISCQSRQLTYLQFYQVFKDPSHFTSFFNLIVGSASTWLLVVPKCRLFLSLCISFTRSWISHLFADCRIVSVNLVTCELIVLWFKFLVWSLNEL